MSLETDLLLDRRRLKRRLVFWRIAAVLALVVAGLAALGRDGRITSVGPHIARVHVDGFITQDSQKVREINALATDPSVKAVILAINSPGGSVTAGEMLHDAIVRVAARKPVVATMGAVAASAGYMIAVPATRIFAHETTLTGSIGVLMEAPEFSGLLDKLGVGAQVIRSGPLKDEPSLVRPLSPAGKAVMQDLVNDMYNQFVAMVAKGRHMQTPAVKALADGRPYTGRQALALGLVDAIGGERAARAWLATAKGVSQQLPVVDIGQRGLVSRTLSGDLEPILVGAWKMLISQSVSLDGGLALWQRSGN